MGETLLVPYSGGNNPPNNVIGCLKVNGILE